MKPAIFTQQTDDAGLRIRSDGKEQTLAVDHVVICAGQQPRRELADTLTAAGRNPHLIGGAHTASELDAKRAIAQAAQLAAVPPVNSTPNAPSPRRRSWRRCCEQVVRKRNEPPAAVG